MSHTVHNGIEATKAGAVQERATSQNENFNSLIYIFHLVTAAINLKNDFNVIGRDVIIDINRKTSELNQEKAAVSQKNVLSSHLQEAASAGNLTTEQSASLSVELQYASTKLEETHLATDSIDQDLGNLKQINQFVMADLGAEGNSMNQLMSLGVKALNQNTDLTGLSYR